MLTGVWHWRPSLVRIVFHIWKDIVLEEKECCHNFVWLEFVVMNKRGQENLEQPGAVLGLGQDSLVSQALNNQLRAVARPQFTFCMF